MVEFTLGFNIQTTGLVFCIMVGFLIGILVGYNLLNNSCDKNLNGTTSSGQGTTSSGQGTTSSGPTIVWDKQNYNMLKNKIITLADDTLVKEEPSLLNCVANRITEESNDQKLMSDDNRFKILLKRVISECKQNGMDPGPPFWTPETYKEFKSVMKTILSDKPPVPTPKTIDCVVDTLVDQFDSRRSMKPLFADMPAFLEYLVIIVKGCEAGTPIPDVTAKISA